MTGARNLEKAGESGRKRHPLAGPAPPEEQGEPRLGGEAAPRSPPAWRATEGIARGPIELSPGRGSEGAESKALALPSDVSSAQNASGHRAPFSLRERLFSSPPALPRRHCSPWRRSCARYAPAPRGSRGCPRAAAWASLLSAPARADAGGSSICKRTGGPTSVQSHQEAPCNWTDPCTVQKRPGS